MDANAEHGAMPPSGRPATTLFIAVAAGIAIANNYALQPALPAVAQTLHVSLAATGLIAGCLQIGYMTGILLLVPLGDRIAPARLVGTQFFALGAALLAAALAPSLTALAVACCVVGALATNAVHLASAAFHLAPAAARGKALGTVASGISAGILLSRFAGGVLTQHAGWRGMLLCFGAVAALLGIASMRAIPTVCDARPGSAGYWELLRSMPGLLLRHRLLREGILVGACWFFVFSALWVTLALSLSDAPLRLDPTQVGLFGFAGLLGLLTTRPAGSLADRLGFRPVIALGLAAVLVGCVVLYASAASIPGIALGVVLFDTGCFAAQVANQTRLLALEPSARNRIYGTYMFAYYAAGALGSVLGPVLFARAGWQPVCAVSAAIAGGGLLLTLLAHYAERDAAASRA
jgi:predicted MFS family arabinose efflux permease